MDIRFVPKQSRLLACECQFLKVWPQQMALHVHVVETFPAVAPILNALRVREDESVGKGLGERAHKCEF